MEHRDALLALLPPPVRAAIAAAGQFTGVDARNAQKDALKPAGEAVGLPGFGYGAVVYPLPSELTAVQRAFAELCAREHLAHRSAMPEGDTLSRWLGLEPPSVLEETVTLGERTLPVWRFLQEKVPAKTVLAVLPTEKQLALLSAYADSVWGYRIATDDDLAWTSPVTETLRGEGEAWARATLAKWTPPVDKQFASGSAYRELSIAQGTTNLAFFALVRAGAEIDPKWDELLPCDQSVPTAIMLECAAALPYERMERAALKVLASAWGPAAVEHGMALLTKYDSRAIAETVIGICSKYNPRQRKAAMEKLLAIGSRQPNVKTAVLVAMGKAPKPIHLEVLARTQPRAASELTASQAAQLVAAGKLWDRKALPVERRLSLDENDEAALGAVLEHVVIGDAEKKPVYEAWLYAGDSGSFFAAGTTKLVAERIQDDTVIRGKANEALRDALANIGCSSKAVRDAAEVKRATEAGAAARAVAKGPAKKTPAKKAPTKKTTAKKAPAKKTPAKKAPAKKQ